MAEHVSDGARPSVGGRGTVFEGRVLERAQADIGLAAPLTWLDDWFATCQISDHVTCIAEPRYHQRNCCYLIEFNGRALLFDTGSGRREIAPALAQLTRSDIVMLPSHLHFDHLGGVGAGYPIWLPDLPVVCGLQVGDSVAPGADMHLGHWEDLAAPTIRVDRWVAPGTTFYLDDLRVEVIHTPGHSPDSISLYLPDEAILLAGDFLYPAVLFAQTPGASLRCYLETAEDLACRLPFHARILAAHAGTNLPFRVPELRRHDMVDLVAALLVLRGSLQRDGMAAHGNLPVNHAISLVYNEAATIPWLHSP